MFLNFIDEAIVKYLEEILRKIDLWLNLSLFIKKGLLLLYEILSL